MITYEFSFLLLFFDMCVSVLNNNSHDVFDCNSNNYPNDTFNRNFLLRNSTEIIIRNCIEIPGMLERCADNCTEHLNKLDICHNNLTHIPTNLFVRMNNISVINFCHNYLTDVELNLPEKFCITTLNLSNNKLENISIGRGCFFELILNQNNFTNIKTKFMSKHFKRLVKLQISYNSVEKIEENTFDTPHNLLELRLNHNKISYLATNAFQPLKRLEILDLSHNLLESLNDELFDAVVELKELYLENNKLLYLGARCFRVMKKLEKLDLSGNKIGFPYHKIHSNPPTPSHANVFWLADLVEKAATRTYLILRVNLSNNDIRGEIDFYRFHYIFFSSYRSINNSIEIDISNNPLNCDCHAFDLISYSQKKFPLPVNSLLHIETDHLVCVQPPRYENISLKYIDLNEITCNTTNLEEYCPQNCTCFHKIASDVIVIDCEQRNIRTISTVKLPMKFAIELYLKNNSISDIDEFLINNNLTNIKLLSLSYNNLSFVPKNIGLIRTLEVLQLDGNRIEYLCTRYIAFSIIFPNIRSIALGRNPWKCNCSINSMISIIKEHKDKIIDLEDIKCANSSTNISTLSKDQMCSNDNSSHLTKIIIFAVVSSSIGAILIKYHYKKKHRKDIKVIISPHRNTEHDIELQCKKFDAFISYSHLDEIFVEQQLVPNLEQNPHCFKICIHHRNFIPGKLITDEIAKSVEESRKTIIVLSENYLASTWSTYEFQTAFLKTIHERNHELIIIMFKEISLKRSKISPALKAYLRTRTYLEIDDPDFWNKLIIALQQ